MAKTRQPDPEDDDLGPDEELDEILAKLNDRQRRFAEEYTVDFSGTRAAERAGYSKATAPQIASRLLKHVHVSRYVSLRLKSMQLSADAALARLREHATSDIADIIEYVKPVVGPDGNLVPGSVRLDLQTILTSGKTHLIKSLSFGQYGPRIEMYDAQSALDKILRAEGAYRDSIRVELDAVVGLEIVSPDTDAEEDDE